MCSLRFSTHVPECVFLARFMFQVVVVNQIRCEACFKAGDVASLVLSNDFARRDLFCEVVSVIGNLAVEALAVKLSLFHPNLLFAAVAEQRVEAG